MRCPAGERDTTALWVAALAVLNSPEYESDAKTLPAVGEGSEIPPPGEPWPELEAAEAFLAKYSEPLEKMHQARELGGAAQYPLKFADGIALLAPEIPRLGDASRLLMLEAEVYAHRGDPRRVAESLRTMLAATRSLEREPIILAQMLRAARNGVACEELERLLPRLKFSDDDLIRLDRDLAAIDYDAALRRALLGERAALFVNIANPASLGTELSPAAAWSPLRNADQLAFLLLMKNYIDATQATQLRVRDAMEQADVEAHAVLNSSSAWWRYPVTKRLTPACGRFADRLWRGKSQRNATRSAIAIERYRRTHGRLPETLDQLVPEFLERVLEDAFDGRPLRYIRAGSGWKIYSIGADLIDQQGARGEAEHPLDIVFEFKPVTHAGADPSQPSRDEK